MGSGTRTPEQVNDAVDGADLTTVYRTLDLLEELGLVKHTHLGHGAPSYRPADDEHVHVVCHTCQSVADAPADLVDDLAVSDSPTTAVSCSTARTSRSSASAQPAPLRNKRSTRGR